jgi:hypothetical protein
VYVSLDKKKIGYLVIYNNLSNICNIAHVKVTKNSNFLLKSNYYLLKNNIFNIKCTSSNINLLF